MKKQQRAKSDQDGANVRFLSRVNVVEKSAATVHQSFQNICQVTVRLLEAACMQVRSEEQEYNDRQAISLLGAKTDSQPFTAQ